jgi:dUTP pyrophosphatase
MSSNNVCLKYHRLANDVPHLNKATEGSACYDVCAYFDPNGGTLVSVYSEGSSHFKMAALRTNENSPVVFGLAAGERALIPTGIILDIPEGYSVRIHPRSGMALKQGITLTNAEGVIDWDYTNELFISVINVSSTRVDIQSGMRIAQLEMVRELAYDVAEGPAPEQKTSRSGGLGSTGV